MVLRSDRLNEKVLTIGDLLDNFIFKGKRVVIHNGEVKLEDRHEKSKETN